MRVFEAEYETWLTEPIEYKPENDTFVGIPSLTIAGTRGSWQI